jgi:hypothetical protein
MMNAVEMPIPIANFGGVSIIDMSAQAATPIIIDLPIPIPIDMLPHYIEK